MKNVKILVCLLMICSLLSGCKFVRPTDADKLNPEVNGDVGKIPLSELIKPDVDGDQTQNLPITEKPVSIVIEKGKDVDLNAFAAFFYEESLDDLQAEGALEITWSEDETYVKRFSCLKDKITLDYFSEGFYGDKKYMFYVSDDNGLAGKRYDKAFPFYYLKNEYCQRLLDLYPEGELESCSPEEAVAFCAPLAEACGYGDAKVDVYAMTKEVLNDFPERARAYTTEAPLEPPYSNMEPTVTLGDIVAAQKAGNEELAKELQKKMQEEAERERGEWTEEHEAYFLVYRSVLNGRLFETTYFSMCCVYVPAYNKVVWMEGGTPAKVVETLEEVELITEQEALAEALRVAKVDSMEDITVVGISMVYSPRYKQANPDVERRIVDPCWRIDYQLSEKLKDNATVANQNDCTILINAVDGRENKYPVG